MIQDISIGFHQEELKLDWIAPIVIPLHYQINRVCHHSGSEEEVQFPSLMVSSNQSFALVPIQHGSECYFTLVAKYNQAGIDRGVTKKSVTPCRSKF